MTLASSVIRSLLLRQHGLRVLPIVGLLALSSSRSMAEDNDAATRTAARDLASQGVEALERHDYTTALDRFERAFTLVPAPSISLLRARSLVQLGRYLEALDVYEKTQRVPLPPDAPEAFKQAVIDAQRESETLWRDVPRLTVHVRNATPPPTDLTITLDSKRVPAALLDVSRPVDPGTHEIAAHAKGFVATSQTITLERGSKTTVDISLVAERENDASLVENRSTRDQHAHSGHSKRIWGWATVGVGSAGLVISGVAGAIALNKHSTLESQCHPGCPTGASEDLNTFRTTRTLSYASLIAGSASIGLGSYLLLSGSSDDSPAVGASIGPAQVRLWGRF